MINTYYVDHCFCFFFVEFGSLTTSQLMEKVRGLQNLAFQLGLDEGKLFCNLEYFSESEELSRAHFSLQHH